MKDKIKDWSRHLQTGGRIPVFRFKNKNTITDYLRDGEKILMLLSA